MQIGELHSPGQGNAADGQIHDSSRNDQHPDPQQEQIHRANQLQLLLNAHPAIDHFDQDAPKATRGHGDGQKAADHQAEGSDADPQEPQHTACWPYRASS